jgi:hypothetical protein
VVLIGRRYWRGLIDWMRKSMLKDTYNKIDPVDLNIFHLTDSLHEAARIIERSYGDIRIQQADRAPSERAPSGEGTYVGKPAIPARLPRKRKAK